MRWASARLLVWTALALLLHRVRPADLTEPPRPGESAVLVLVDAEQPKMVDELINGLWAFAKGCNFSRDHPVVIMRE